MLLVVGDEPLVRDFPLLVQILKQISVQDLLPVGPVELSMNAFWFDLPGWM